jgi:hypothetical protein
MKKLPDPSAMIITGSGFIGFGLLYHFAGIFPSRSGVSPRWGAVTATEDPVRFRLAVLMTLAIGVLCLFWGLFRLMRR